MNQDASATEALDDETITMHSSNGDSVYASTIGGFAGTLDEAAAIEELRNHPGVSEKEAGA